MKIFLASTSLHPTYGGPAYSVSRLAGALTKAGADVALWAADGSALSTLLLPAQTAVVRLTGSVAEALVSAGRIDILHDNGIWRPHNRHLSTLANKFDIPRLVSTRGMLEPWAFRHKRLKKSIAWTLYQRRDLKRAQLHHATAIQEAQNVRALGLGVSVRVIPNGVDVPNVNVETVRYGTDSVSSAGQRTALFLGRIYPIKGLPMLVEAWARVRPHGWRLQIAGPDESGHRAEVERAVLMAGLGDVVSFIGPVEGLAKSVAFSNADFLILPSHSESFGMVVVEALAHGLPVLTTSGTPWPGLLERGCGWWVNPTVDGLAEGLVLATSLDSATLRTMGMKGRAWVSAEFAWESIATQFLAAYEQLLAQKRSLR